MKEDQRQSGERERKSQVDKTKLVLTTSLGVALMANLAYVPVVQGSAVPAASSAEGKLVEWSSDAVKAYFDPKTDWSLVLPAANDKPSGDAQTSPSPTPSVAPGGSNAGSTTYMSHGGFGWDDLLLYHLLFNRGGVYSSNQWYSGRSVSYAGTNRAYTPQKFDSSKFQNKTMPGSKVTPKTSNSTGAIVRRSTTSTGKSTSSSSGSIGGKSSGFSSSGSSKSSSSFGS